MQDVVVPEWLFSSQTVANAVTVAVTSVVAFAAINRSKLDMAQRLKLGRRMIAAGFAWLLIVSILSVQGIFARTPGAMAAGLLVPIIAFSVLLARSAAANQVLDAMPAAWLIRMQVTRVVGAAFLLLYVQGFLPGEFAIAAGLGDFAIGITALFVARMVRSGRPNARIAGIIWNVAGIFDLVNASMLGFLTAPGTFQRLALANPNQLITHYPLVLIPMFAVPLAVILHILSLRKLASMRVSESGGAYAAEGAR